jgi:predicted negative regulator of RcsB-dependent stress response
MTVPSRNVTCYGRFVKGENARERIQKLIVTGDNRLKQGVDPAKARQSYEQALQAAREAGLEEAIRPLVEIRLADLERLAGESPPPSPPDA